MFAARDPSDIERFFRGLTEYAFLARLGVVDPPLVDYVALLLVRFLRHDILGSAPTGDGTSDVATLLAAARDHAPDTARAEYRHVGDYTLFWTGLYPEALRRRGRPSRGGRLDEFRAAGKQAYWIASTCAPPAAVERSVLERLSRDYDTCAEGLAEVRRAWGES